MNKRITSEHDKRDYDLLQDFPIPYKILKRSSKDIIKSLRGQSGRTLAYEAKKLGLRTDAEGLAHFACARGHKYGDLTTFQLAFFAGDKDYDIPDQEDFSDEIRRLQYLRKLVCGY